MIGPFCENKDLNLNIFVKGLEKIKEDRPHLVILGGPFLSTENTTLEEGEIKRFKNDNNSLNSFEIFDIIISKINEIFKVRFFLYLNKLK